MILIYLQVEDELLWPLLVFILLSLISLSLTTIIYNNDPPPVSSQIYGAVNIILNCCYRVIIISIMFTISAKVTIIMLVLTYLIMVVVHYNTGDGRHSLLLGYCNLVIPTGHSLGMNFNTSKSLSSSEVERVRINKAALIPRMKRWVCF